MSALLDKNEWQKAKCAWLLEVARHPAMTFTGLATAVACADSAWRLKNHVVDETQTELAAMLDKSQGTVSVGCRLLAKLGFLAFRVNGNRTIYSLDFDPGSRPAAIKKPPRGGAKLSPHERSERRKKKTSINQPRQIKNDQPQQINEDAGIGGSYPTVNISPGRSTSSARADEHYTPDPLVGGAYSAPLTTICAEGSSVESIDSLGAQDRAPKGAVLTDDHLELAKLCFGVLSDDDVVNLETLARQVGIQRFAVELVNLKLSTDCTVLGVYDWVQRIERLVPRAMAHA